MMGAKDKNHIRRLLIHARFTVHGCYKDAIKLSMTYPTIMYSGKLIEMKDKGRFSNNNTVFQHRIVSNWVIKRQFANGSSAYYGVERKDCSFLFGDVQCRNLHNRCIPTNTTGCEIAMFKTDDKIFTLIRPFDGKYLVATTVKRYEMKNTRGEIEILPIITPVFTLSVPKDHVAFIGNQQIEGTTGEKFNFDSDESKREHQDDEMVDQLKKEIAQYVNVDYAHQHDRPLDYKVAEWIVFISAWTATITARISYFPPWDALSSPACVVHDLNRLLMLLLFHFIHFQLQF